MVAAVLPWLYVGDRGDAKDKDLLLKLKISHILNVTPRRSVDPVAGVPNFFPTEFTYNRCEIFDNDATNLLPILTNCIAFIEEGKHFGSVLVHCNKGVSRSCSVIIAYLIKSQGMSKKDALTHVQQTRPQANPNSAFSKQLDTYEAICRSNKKSTSLPVVRGPAAPPSSLSEVDPHDGDGGIGVYGDGGSVAEGGGASPIIAPNGTEEGEAKGDEDTFKDAVLLCEECEEAPRDMLCMICKVHYCSTCSSLAHTKLGDHTMAIVPTATAPTRGKRKVSEGGAEDSEVKRRRVEGAANVEST